MLRYIRSMPSTSRVTCCLRTSATERGRLMGGSGRHDPSGSTNRFAVQFGDALSIPTLRNVPETTSLFSRNMLSSPPLGAKQGGGQHGRLCTGNRTEDEAAL